MTHLRLVHPVPAPPPRPKRRKYQHGPPVFSSEECDRIRAALRHARALFGTWACAADAMYLRKEQVIAASTGRIPVTANIAVRLARALGEPLDALLRPLSEAGTCPTCGARRAP